MGTVPITIPRVIFSNHDLPGVGDFEPLAPHFYLCKRSISQRCSSASRQRGEGQGRRDRAAVGGGVKHQVITSCPAKTRTDPLSRFRAPLSLLEHASTCRDMF
eukprot:COSAG06_NODE_31132_length_526_cov_1.435597_1_plen_102_part_10